MPIYNITATRETCYEFEVEADSHGEAEAKVRDIELSDDVETYAYDWYPLEIIDVQEVED